MFLEGPILRLVADHRTGHFFLRHFSHGGLGQVLLSVARSLGLLKDRRPVELSLSVMRYFFEPFLEVEKEHREEAVIHLRSCPYGFGGKGDILLCDAVMQLERNLVDGIGGTLFIEETIPEGAPKCRFTIKAKPLP